MIKQLRKQSPTLLQLLGRGRVALVNRLRMRRAKLDYVTLTLPAEIPALPEARGWLRQRLQGPPPVSLWELEGIFERIAADPRPKGVILSLRGLRLSLADLQTLRGSILRLRERGKQVICHAPYYDLAQYYLASAADQILLQPGGELMTIGLRQETVFLKDALAAVGVALDVVAISPYKGAFDQLSRDTVSPEAREQMEWLLDSRYDMLIADIAAGRGVPADDVRRMIAGAPHIDATALAAGYVDGVVHEEGLYTHLKAKHIVPMKRADKQLLIKPPKPTSERYVALLRVSGLMISGESAKPPADLPIPFIGGERTGDLTLIQQIRVVMQDKNAAAVLLYVDSGGGAAIAAEAMTSALEELAKSRPLVVYMNAIAASGGYYVATPARWIVAQPGTITGSIGVVTAKPITRGLRERLHVNTFTLTRGANASLYSDIAPFSDGQRAQVRASIEAAYRRFLDRVARGREMTVEAVDSIGGGRVWTGAQAHAHGLVDELGDVRAALKKARALANLPDYAPVTFVGGKGKNLPPQLAEINLPGASMRYLHASARAIANGMAQVLLPLWWR